MQQQNWRRTITMYVSEAEYQLIMSKAKSIDISASKLTKQAVKTYIKLEKHLEDAEPVAA
jgi:phage anti-repressor protein